MHALSFLLDWEIDTVSLSSLVLFKRKMNLYSYITREKIINIW